MKVKVSQLKVKSNIRTELGDISGLVASIKDRISKGLPPLIQPIVVDKDLVVLAGHRRRAALVIKHKPTPEQLAQILLDTSYQEDDFIMVGAAKMEGKKFSFKKGLTYEDVARVVLYSAATDNQDGLIQKLIPFDETKVEQDIDKVLRPKRAELEPLRGEGYYYPDAVVKAAAEFVRGKPLVLPAAPKDSPAKTAEPEMVEDPETGEMVPAES